MAISIAYVHSRYNVIETSLPTSSTRGWFLLKYQFFVCTRRLVNGRSRKCIDARFPHGFIEAVSLDEGLDGLMIPIPSSRLFTSLKPSVALVDS